MENSVLAVERHMQLLRLEYEAEREEYLLQAQNVSVEHKVRHGICWWGVAIGRNYYNSLNQLVVEIHRSRTDDSDEIEHLFEYGKPVRFFTIVGRSSSNKPLYRFLDYN